MTLKEALQRANSSAWKDATSWLVLNILVLLVPVCVTYLYFLLNTGNVDFLEPIRHGELSLFGLSLLGTGAYSLMRGIKISGLDQIKKDKKAKGIEKAFEAIGNIHFPGFQLFFLAMIGGIISALILFMFSFPQNTFIPNYEIIHQIRIIIIIMLLCLTTSFIIILIESSLVNSPLNVEAVIAESTNKAQQQLRAEWRQQ
jgi:hypothetical protein